MARAGPRLFDWARVLLLHQWEDDARHWLLIRRCISDPKHQTYYLVWAPPATTLEATVKAIGARWHIEEDFETSKDMGLADYARPLLHRLVSPHHACHARSCFFSCYLFSEQERHCGRRISPFPCSPHPSRDPRCRGLPLSPSSQHSSSSCCLCTSGIPSSFSCSPLFPAGSQDIALSPRSPPSSPDHSRSSSSAWTSHLALVAASRSWCWVGPRGADGTAAWPATTIPNVAWRLGNPVFSSLSSCSSVAPAISLGASLLSLLS